MKRILVTGGAGFIGSNLIKKLVTTTNYHIVCIDNFDPFYDVEQKKNNISQLIYHPQFSLIEGDIRNASDLEQIKNIDIIVHLAAKAGVRPSLADPTGYLDVNVNGTLQLLNYAVRNNIKQFVFASSSSVYGVNPNVPWTENEELMPISPYASTKLMGEMLGESYAIEFDIRFIALRFFTVYGAAQRPDLAIHKFFKAITNDKPITLFGNGLTQRDYTYVDDTVSGIIAAIHYEGAKFETINLGNNHTVSLINLVNTIEDCLDKKAIIEWHPEQEGDVPQTFANINKANSLLNYNPSTQLKDGLNKFLVWFKQTELAH